jgi:hypothetical protein
MSKEKNVVGEIKSLMMKFGFLKSDNFVKLVDGTEIRVDGDELVEGAAVYVVTEEGDIPAPDAVHELEDGTKVETKDGMIVSIEAKQEVEDSMEEEIVEEEVEMEEVVEVEVPAEVPAEVAAPAVEAIVEAIMPILEKVKDLEEELKKVKSSFESFRNEPAGKPVNKTKKEFSATDVMVERILALRNSK